MVEKPPLGLKPRTIHDFLRLAEIAEAVSRYMAAVYPVPDEWVAEYNELVERLRSGDEK